MNNIFKSGLKSNFSNSTVMKKSKQVSHSKQETISAIFTHPSPNPSAPQNIVRKFQNYCRCTGHKTLLITSSTFINILVLKTTKAN